MRSTRTTILALAALLLPIVASASSSGIYIENVAGANSGGIHASGSDISSGDSGASVEIHTVMNGSEVQSTYDTEVNGVHTTRSFTAPIPAGANASFDYSTTTDGSHIELHVRAGGTSSSSVTVQPNATRAASAPVAPRQASSSAIHPVRMLLAASSAPATSTDLQPFSFSFAMHNFFAHLFGFFGISL